MQDSSSHLLSEQIEQALRTNPHLAGRYLRFETQEEQVILRGTVGSYFQKQMAQEALRRVVGNRCIQNCLEVAWR